MGTLVCFITLASEQYLMVSLNKSSTDDKVVLLKISVKFCVSELEKLFLLCTCCQRNFDQMSVQKEFLKGAARTYFSGLYRQCTQSITCCQRNFHQMCAQKEFLKYAARTYVSGLYRQCTQSITSLCQDEDSSSVKCFSVLRSLGKKHIMENEITGTGDFEKSVVPRNIIFYKRKNLALQETGF
jgi:hypothetical protein